MFQGAGKTFLLAGAVLVIIGLILTIAGRFHFPLGKLPGDIIIRRQDFTVFIPLVSMLLISVILTVVLNVIFRFFR